MLLPLIGNYKYVIIVLKLEIRNNIRQYMILRFI